MMSNYAKNTNVSVSKSQAEVQNILRRYGADRFGTVKVHFIPHLRFTIIPHLFS